MAEAREHINTSCSVLQRGAVYGTVLHCVAVCCIMLRCCSVLHIEYHMREEDWRG